MFFGLDRYTVGMFYNNTFLNTGPNPGSGSMNFMDPVPEKSTDPSEKFRQCFGQFDFRFLAEF